MASDPPALTTLVQRGFRQKFPAISPEPTHRELGQVTLFLKAATEAYANDDHSAEPQLEVAELGQIQAYAHTLGDQVVGRNAAATTPNSLEDFMKKVTDQLTAIQAKLDDLEATVKQTGEDAKTDSRRVQEELRDTKKGLQGELRDAKKELQKESKKELNNVRDDIKKLGASLGRWSVPFAKKFNRECHLGTGFQAVAYSDGTMPDNDTMANLVSIETINQLDQPTLETIARKYGIPTVARRRTEQLDLKHDLLVHIGASPPSPPAGHHA